MDWNTCAQLQCLMAEYWRRIDGLSAHPPEQLFTEGGRMRIGATECVGRDALAAFFCDRARNEAASQRTTRHIMSQMAVEPLAPDRVKLYSTVQVLVGTGPLPQPSALPATVADFEDIAVREPQGWLFESRHARIVFTGPGAATFAR